MDETSQVSGKRRWPGLILSFFVPGFGLIRAGLPRRGIAWLFGLMLLGLILAASLALAAVPLDFMVFSTLRLTALHKLTGNTGENFFIQRLVGMAGETIRNADGKVFANGKPLGEADGIPPFHYLNPRGFPSAVLKEGEDFVVGSDEYFVLGDNTSNSLDSRATGDASRVPPSMAKRP